MLAASAAGSRAQYSLRTADPVPFLAATKGDDMSPPEPHPRTISTFDALFDVVWFRNCGLAEMANVKQLTSWPAAIQQASSTKWETIGLEAANGIALKLIEKDKILYNSWNDKVAIIKPFVDALVDEKINYIPEKEFSSSICAQVKWDILHLGIECEFSDHIEPGFYHTLAFYYREGHFPCGVEGAASTGRMIIY